MKLILSLSIVFTFGIFSCKQASLKSKTETLEIFKTVGTEVNMEAGEMQYYEATEYEGRRKKSTSYFEANGLLKGKEVFGYDDSQDTVPIKADYFDNNNKLLSYYKYIKNNKGQSIASFAFDASNDELLRIEQYNYKDSKIHSKRVFDAAMNPSRRYAFTYDQYGNETSFQVYNAKDSIMAYESFKITKMDPSNHWVEKWGFVNGKPMTLHKKKK